MTGIHRPEFRTRRLGLLPAGMDRLSVSVFQFNPCEAVPKLERFVQCSAALRRA